MAFIGGHPELGSRVNRADLTDHSQSEQGGLGLDRLSAEERLLVDRRSQGHGWPEIAAELHESAEVLRKRLTRALDRVTRELGLEVEGS